MWNPNILSREKSFHHKKEIKIVNKTGNKTIKNENFILMNKTTLPRRENKTKDTNKGQKDVWTAKNGDIKIS